MTPSLRLRPYLSFFRLRFLGGMQYRVAALAGILTQFAWGAMNLLLYTAFYEADPTAFPMDFAQISVYVWFNQAFLTMFIPPKGFTPLRRGSSVCKPTIISFSLSR